MMRLLFIYPNLNAQIGFNYGIAYMSGLLKARGIETFLLNVNEQLGYPLDHDRIARDVERISPDLVGFSVLTNQYKYALDMAASLKARFDHPIVFGGIHPTMDPQAVLSEKAVDYICMGEGEEALLETCEKGSPEGVRNMGFRRSGESILEPLRPYTDIRSLPPKDYEIFDFQKMIDAKDGWVGLLASRGCPYRCTYCLNHKIIRVYKDSGCSPKLYIRRHSVEQVMGEIDYLLSRYSRIKMFIFDDDLFTFDKEWLAEFSRAYRKATRIGFVCNAHVRMFDEETASYLKEAGCRIVKFGIESGSDRVRREVLHRYMTNRDIESAFGAAHKFGLHTSAFVMIGLPGEKEADLMETIRLLARVRPGRFRWSLFFPYVGTRAYEIAAGAGAIDMEKMAALDNFTDETCMDLGPEVNLLVDKVKDTLCAFVNGYAAIPEYASIVSEIESLGDAAWKAGKEASLRRIERIDSDMAKAGKLHYRVKYNRFMGVRSDWEDDHISA
jgi:anaerobic magnesium-protoporphyrin IX monomethyl ester cyclase